MKCVREGVCHTQDRQLEQLRQQLADADQNFHMARDEAASWGEQCEQLRQQLADSQAQLRAGDEGYKSLWKAFGEVDDQRDTLAAQLAVLEGRLRTIVKLADCEICKAKSPIGCAGDKCSIYWIERLLATLPTSATALLEEHEAHQERLLAALIVQAQTLSKCRDILWDIKQGKSVDSQRLTEVMDTTDQCSLPASATALLEREQATQHKLATVVSLASRYIGLVNGFYLGLERWLDEGRTAEAAAKWRATATDLEAIEKQLQDVLSPDAALSPNCETEQAGESEHEQAMRKVLKPREEQ
jgi:hypothetical protein